MRITTQNCKIVFKNDLLYDIEIYINETHKLHTSYGLSDVIVSRDELIGTNIETAEITKEDDYYRVRAELGIKVKISNGTKSELTIYPVSFHTEKLNLATAVMLYDIIKGNNSR